MLFFLPQAGKWGARPTQKLNLSYLMASCVTISIITQKTPYPKAD